MANRDLFNWAPDYESSEEAEARLHTIALGDGYSQDVAAGLNNIADKFSWSFKRGAAEVAAIRTFLRAHMQGQRFDLTLPRGRGTIAVVCSKYSVTDVGFNQLNLSVTFERRYD